MSKYTGDGWNDIPPAPRPKYSLRDVLRITRRALILALVTFSGLGLLLLMRLIERPLAGQNRPVTPYITQAVCKAAFFILGMKRTVEGAPMKHAGACVANHVSWLDIFTLNASKRIYFVAKSEVAKWPGIGWLARATGTIFIRREARDAALQQAVFETRLAAGHRLMFFPEGTSTDGLRVLPFKSTLFEPFFKPALKGLYIQPITLTYTAPKGDIEPRFYGWWGEMEFAPNLLQVLAQKQQGTVQVTYHPALAVADFKGRKDLAQACYDTVNQGLQSKLTGV